MKRPRSGSAPALVRPEFSGLLDTMYRPCSDMPVAMRRLLEAIAARERASAGERASIR